MSKSTANIRRGQPIDQLFIGMHGLTTVEDWREGQNMIKGVGYSLKRIDEKDGHAGIGGPGHGHAGWLLDLTAEIPQNMIEDYDFMEEVLNGLRNLAIVTGKGPTAMLRLFRTKPLGGGRWQDNRVSMSASDIYSSSLDKITLHITRWVRGYERYEIKQQGSQPIISVSGGRLIYTVSKSPKFSNLISQGQ